MSSIDSIGSSQQTSQQIANTVSNATTAQIGTSQFLQLLVAQLQNQDPLQPVDNQQFIAQLATFSSLEQLVSINQGITKLAGAASADSNEVA
jgi:flagellar basal-body rod modification protein FlgD